jgi:hypothetical protein
MTSLYAQHLASLAKHKTFATETKLDKDTVLVTTPRGHEIVNLKETKFCVYRYLDPRPDKNFCPIYVGKGNSKRARAHLGTRCHNPTLKSIVAKIRKTKLNPIVEIIGRFRDENDASRCEIDLIAQYGRRDLGTGTLCNLTDGGEGTSGLLGAAERGRQIMYRLHADPIWHAKSIERLHRAHNSLEFKTVLTKRARQSMIKNHADPAFTATRLERLSRLNADPAFKMKSAERMRRLNADPAFRAESAKRGRAQLLLLHKDPIEQAKKRARLAAARNDPVKEANRKAKQAEALIRYWADPAKRIAAAERMREQKLRYWAEKKTVQE